MSITLRRCARSSSALGLIVAGLLGSASVGCRTAGPIGVVSNSACVPLPPLEREVGPDGSEVAAAPTPNTASAPKTWQRKFADFCTPKPPPKSASNRVYESDNIPYSD